jgi:hypothetical protein
MVNRNSTTTDENNTYLSPNVGGLQDNQITFVNFSNNYCICIIDIIESTNNTYGTPRQDAGFGCAQQPGT